MKFTLDTDRLCSPGSGANRYPRSTLLCSPPTPSYPSAAAQFVPSPWPTRAACFFFFSARASGARSAAAAQTKLRPCPGSHHRRPVVAGLASGSTRASQVTGPSSSCVPQPVTPPGATRSRQIETRRRGLQVWTNPERPGKNPFSGLTRAAHMFAHLRIDDSITGDAARLATGWCGYTLAGRDSHPLDDTLNFDSITASPLLSDRHCLVASPMLG